MRETKSAGSFIDVTRHDGVVVIKLDRPEKHNALSRELVLELTAEIHACDSNPDVRTILVTGNEQAFSTGVDLTEALKVVTDTQYRELSSIWRKLTEAIEHSGIPVIACINGYCITGGLEIALACDYRIASPSSVMGMTSGKIGSVAGIGATQRLPRLVGQSRAKWLLFTAEFVGADEALGFGLVDEIADDGDVLSAGMSLAAKISATAPLSARWHKEAVTRALDMPLVEGLDLEASLSMQAFMTSDKQEGMSAFLERRQADFEGY